MYKMMTAKEAIDYLIETKDKSFDFTFDNLDFDPYVEPGGWYGVKIINIFDENPYGFFVMGYYGGGSTEGYDVYGNVEDADNIEKVKEFMSHKLQAYMNIWYDCNEVCERICVEIKDSVVKDYDYEQLPETIKNAQCCHCGKIHEWDEDTCAVYQGKLLCADCYNDYYGFCNVCETLYKYEDMNDDIICKNCEKEN